MGDNDRGERGPGSAFATESGEGDNRPLLTALLPVRNAEADLAGYLENVGTYCDAIVALDDGSTDGTFDTLAAHPLVKVLLRNPRREDYRGWNDAANRNRLIDASAQLDPVWLISIDADERLDAADAASLREFLQSDALPGVAYGFRHVPMREDPEHFLPRYWWAYRLFSAAPGQRFPDTKLHFVPIPTSIPRQRWIKTTLRIQHFGELTAERRLARFGKYLEADPGRKYEDFYAECLATRSAEELGRWLPRPKSVPVLFGSAGSVNPDEPGQGVAPAVPTMSVIIVDLDDDGAIERAVRSVMHQDVAGDLEVLVVSRTGSRTARAVRDTFPSVTLVVMPDSVPSGKARNEGLIAARGRFITFLTPETVLSQGSLLARMSAHRRGYAMVTGTVANGSPSPSGWASYFLEHADALPGHQAAEVYTSQAHCSYARLALIEVGGFPETVRTGEESLANHALIERGYVTYRDAATQIIDHGPDTIRHLILRQYHRGRDEGRMVLARHRYRGRLLRRENIKALVTGAVPLRVRRIDQGVARAHVDIQAEYQRHRYLVVAGALVALAGEWWEILRPGPGKLAILWRKPVLDVLLGGQQSIALAQIDAISGESIAWPVPADIEVSAGEQLVSLAEVLWSDTNDRSRHLRPQLRQLASEALDVEQIECIVDPGLRLPRRSLSSQLTVQPATGLGEAVCRIGDVVRTIRAMRRNALRSTLNPWTTARVLRQVGQLAKLAGPVQSRQTRRHATR